MNQARPQDGVTTFRATIAPMGGTFMLSVSADVRDKANETRQRRVAKAVATLREERP